MGKRTTGNILHDIVGEIETTGGALRRLSNLLAELARSIVTGTVPEPPDDDTIVPLPAGRDRERR
jgi:hypothetical protein